MSTAGATFCATSYETPAATPGVWAHHQAELNQGRWFIQRCTACEKAVYFPRALCPHCGHLGLAWVAPSGLGTVHAVTTVKRKASDGGDLNISLVELDEGVRLMSRVDNLPPAAVTPGLRVRGRVQLHEGRGLVVFDAIEEGTP